MTTKGYVGLGARTFGNPGGATSGNGSFNGGGGGPRQNVFLNAFAHMPGVGWIASGLFNIVTSTSKSVLRFASSVNGLATAADINITGADPNGMGLAFAGGGMFVSSDFVQTVITSQNGTAWTVASSPAGLFIAEQFGAIYDDIHNKVICVAIGANTATVMTATPGPGPVTFTAVTLGGPNDLVAIAYRPGSGVTLALTNSGGGTNQGDVWRSTDGGATWALVAPQVFGGINNSFALFFAGGPTNRWLAFGGDTNSMMVVSTDNGSTWSAPAVWFNTPNNNYSQVALAGDGAGNLVMQTNQGSLDWSIVSADFGATWSSPQLIVQNVGTTGVVWDGSQWSIGGSNVASTAANFLTSADGIHWTIGPDQSD